MVNTLNKKFLRFPWELSVFFIEKTGKLQLTPVVYAIIIWSYLHWLDHHHHHLILPSMTRWFLDFVILDPLYWILIKIIPSHCWWECRMWQELFSSMQWYIESLIRMISIVNSNLHISAEGNSTAAIENGFSSWEIGLYNSVFGNEKQICFPTINSQIWQKSHFLTI